MSVARVYEWRTPGCDEMCIPRRHDPDAHERYGYLYAHAAPLRWLVTTGPLTVDLWRRVAMVDGVEIMLFAQQWRLLAALAWANGRVVEHAELTAAIGFLDDAAARRAVVVTIHRLRGMLGRAAGQRIVTVHGQGYRLEVDS